MAGGVQDSGVGEHRDPLQVVHGRALLMDILGLSFLTWKA